MREGDFDLHLLARGDTAVERLGIVENAPDQRMVFRLDRKGEFAADQEMREIGEQRQVRAPVEKIEREKEVRGHPVAVRFDEDRNTGILGQAHPAVEQG